MMRDWSLNEGLSVQVDDLEREPIHVGPPPCKPSDIIAIEYFDHASNTWKPIEEMQ